MAGDPSAIGDGKGAHMGKTSDVREAVEKELGYDSLLAGADITVRNINGDVTLRGAVHSYRQYLEAAMAACRVAGVTRVHNHLKVILPSGDVRDDAMLTTAANNALTANVTVPAGVEAAARNGNLTLTGAVPYHSQRVAAEKAVSGLTGVRGVRDEIELACDVDPADVRWQVEKALERSALVPDGSDVTVITSGNTVTLIGQVRTCARRDAVVDAAWRGHGVMAVLDELTVTGGHDDHGGRPGGEDAET
jgi:osmotically-inducible protein OsmY